MKMKRVWQVSVALCLAAGVTLTAIPALAQDDSAGSPDAEGQNELTLVVGENKTLPATG